MLTETKMRLAAGNHNLDCERLKNPGLFKPKIEDNIKERELLQFREDNKVKLARVHLPRVDGFCGGRSHCRGRQRAIR